MREKVRCTEEYKNYVNHFRQQKLSAVLQDTGRRTEGCLPYKREVVGSPSFNLEYYPYTTRRELKQDIVSYLGEYRFKLQKFKYEMRFFKGDDGEIGLRDPDRGELMRTKAKRVIEERKGRGDPVHREAEELKGIYILEKQLSFAKDGDTVLWASPPGPEEEGYGEYGFVYVGKVEKHNEKNLILHMMAIRVEKPTIEGFNKAMSLLSGVKIKHREADEFLGEPLVVGAQVEERFIDSVLKKHFSFIENLTQKKRFEKIIQDLNPVIEDCMDIIEKGSGEEKMRALHALENYALRLKSLSETSQAENIVYLERHKNNARLRDIMPFYSYRPPVVGGSCGATGKMESNNLLSLRFSVKAESRKTRDYEFDKKATCVQCGRYAFCGPCDICESCNDQIDAAELLGNAA